MYFRIVLSVASLLIYAGIASAAPFAYIANKTDNTVSVLDTASNKVVQVVPVGTAPYGVAVNRMGSRVYVSNTGDNTISVIDTMDNSVTSIPLSVMPGALAVNSAGTRLFVANDADDSVSVINTATKTVVSTLPMAPSCQPQGIAVGPADGFGNYRAFVSCYGPDVVSVIEANDATTYTLSGTQVIVPAGPRGITVSADGQKVYVASLDAGKLTVIDALTLATPAATDTITAGMMPLGIAVDPTAASSATSARLYVVDAANNTVSVVNTKEFGTTGDMKVIATQAVGSSPVGVAFTGDGLKAVTSDNSYAGQGTASIILKSDNSVTTVNGDSGPLTTPPNMIIGAGPNSFGNFAGPDFVNITTGVSDYNCGKVDTSELITSAADIYKVAKGQDVVFNITPYVNCSTSAVSIDSGASIGTPATYTFAAPTADHSIYATFTRNAWITTVNKFGTGTGTVVSKLKIAGSYVDGTGGVNCGASCSGTNPTNSIIAFYAAPSSDSLFSGWAGVCSGKLSCELTLNQATAILKGGESGTFNILAEFTKKASGPVRTNRGGTVQYKTTLQEAYDAVAAATAANPIDIDTTVNQTLSANKNVAVTLVGGWTEWTAGGVGTLPTASASNITGPFTVALGSVTIGSYNNLGAVVIK